MVLKAQTLERNAEALLLKYGRTNPVANCGKAHNVPDWVAFCFADAYMHGARKTATEAAAFDYMRRFSIADRQPLYNELALIAAYFE